MNENKENIKLIPNLRFPEFKDAGEWVEKKLGDDSLINILNNKRKPITSSQRTKGKYPYYGASGIVDYINDYIFDETLVLLGEDGAKWGAFEETAFIAKGKYWVNNHAHVIKPIKIDEVFLKNYLVMIDINPFITGFAPPKLNLENLKKIPVLLPKKPTEQQKIAACLSSLDELIEARKQKLERLKQHKKGLMQNLFPQEGEKVPKLRFPEFKDIGEWEVKPLRNISKKINEKTKGRKFKLMSITAGEGLISQMEKFGREIAGNSYKNYYVIHKNDFAYNKSSTKPYPQGEIAMYEDEEIGAVPNSIFTCFRFNIKIIHPVFAKYHFVNNLHGKWLLNYITIGARAHGALQVNEKDLFSLPFSFPTIKEQQKIAACLSSLDELIEAEAEKIELLEKHKKGLMQGMFPSYE